MEEIVYTGHTDLVENLIFSPCSKVLASSECLYYLGSRDSSIRLWNGVPNIAERGKDGHRYKLASVHFLPDNLRMLTSNSNYMTASEDCIKLWNVITGN